MDYLEESLS